MSKQLLSPVSTDTLGGDSPAFGIGFCLSGGGYRAMLYHLGVLWRLAEIGYLGTRERTSMHGPIGTLQRVACVYRRRLFSNKTLQDLPDSPSFVIKATNLQSGELWRYSKPFKRDRRVGEIRNPVDFPHPDDGV